MCSGIAFLFGLFLLFRGEFRIANRTIPRQQSRAIALILMAPPIVAFIAGLFLFSSATQITYDQLIQVTFIELGSLVIALGLVAYNIYNLPTSPDVPLARSTTVNPMPAAQPPDIMTLAEAAAYMRVSEAEVLRLIEESRLGAVRSGSSYKIARIAIDDFLRGSAG